MIEKSPKVFIAWLPLILTLLMISAPAILFEIDKFAVCMQMSPPHGSEFFCGHQEGYARPYLLVGKILVVAAYLFALSYTGGLEVNRNYKFGLIASSIAIFPAVVIWVMAAVLGSPGP